MTRRFFGTDGIRSAVGVTPMTPAGVMQLGWALGTALAQRPTPRVLIGADTRESGAMFMHATAAGLLSSGAHVIIGGILPTPAVAYLTRVLGLEAGVVISASHNLYTDNGIKYFSQNGYKLPDEMEAQIEGLFDKPLQMSPVSGMSTVLLDGAQRYTDYVSGTIGTARLEGLRVVIDTAQGAAYDIGPRVLEALGATVIAIHHTPDGQNINAGCGAMHPASLAEAVQLHQADVGFALDGDGDRLMMVDASGEIFEGDRLLYILTMARHRKGSLHGGVVGTVMSNLGLAHALKRADIPFDRASVGDRHVLKKLLTHKWTLGGENSGHLISLDHSTTGDGLLAALQILVEMVQREASLAMLAEGLVLYPQILRNVRMAHGARFMTHPSVERICHQAQMALGAEGRLVLRPSGTEPLVRIMLEGADPEILENWAERIAETLLQVVAVGVTSDTLA